VKRFRLSTLAEADLDEIWLYVARDRSVEVANRLIDDIRVLESAASREVVEI